MNTCVSLLGLRPPREPRIRRASRMPRRGLCLAFILLSCSLLHPPAALGSVNTACDGLADALEVANGDSPAHGRSTISLEPLWQTGGAATPLEHCDAITHVKLGPDNLLYMLSPKRGLYAFDRDGVYRKHIPLSEVAPPGVTAALGFFFLPNGNISWVFNRPALTQFTPTGDILTAPTIDSPQFGRILTLFDGDCQGGHLVLAGVTQDFLSRFPDDSEQRWYSVLSRFNIATGTEEVCYAKRVQDYDFDDYNIAEADEYFPISRRWALSSAGTVYLAPVRDSYVIHVFDSDGICQHIISRSFEAPQRRPESTAALERAHAARLRRRGETGSLIPSKTDPVITSLTCRPDGELWVRHAASFLPSPGASMLSYDVFDHDGVYSNIVTVRCHRFTHTDALHWIDDEHAVLVSGMNAPQAIDPIGSGGEATLSYRPDPLIVVCLRSDK